MTATNDEESRTATPQMTEVDQTADGIRYLGAVATWPGGTRTLVVCGRRPSGQPGWWLKDLDGGDNPHTRALYHRIPSGDDPGTWLHTTGLPGTSLNAGEHTVTIWGHGTRDTHPTTTMHNAWRAYAISPLWDRHEHTSKQICRLQRIENLELALHNNQLLWEFITGRINELGHQRHTLTNEANSIRARHHRHHHPGRLPQRTEEPAD